MDSKRLEQARRRAWEVVEGCDPDGKGLRAASGSSLYPHVWTRDVGMAALGVLAGARNDRDVVRVRRSAELLARHRDELGRAPLKVDVARDIPVSENSAGVDAGMWLALMIGWLDRVEEVEEPLVDAASSALHWTRHLDVDGDGLLETPEASDWADMMPHRHHVLFPNVLHVTALLTHARVLRARGRDAEADLLVRRAELVRERVRLAFWLEGCESAAGVGRWLERLEAACPEWAISGQYASRWGDLPYFLPYVGFRVAGRHCDVVGNLLAILTGVADARRRDRILDHLDRVGASEPRPTRAIDPPLYPGDSDYRDHFQWRGLNVPHQYQNGGSWPFIGALHVAALVAAGRDAEPTLEALVASVEDPTHPFPEWHHGRTGAPMGEARQLWSATGLLYAMACVERGRALLFATEGADG